MSPTQPWWADRSVDLRPPAARGAGSRRPFGSTWWGQAWIGALERQARLDPHRLSRGRGYARRGTVLETEIVPGAVIASVQGTRPQPYEVRLAVAAFTDPEWDRLLDVISARLGHLAALLDGELPPEVVDDVTAAGLSLLPGPTELRPSCSCPDFAVPCKHAAAVCYVVADELDQDPFTLLALRGRTREAVIAALRARRTGTGEAAPAPDETPVGVVAGAAYELWARSPRTAPAAPLPPTRPAQVGALGIAPPPGLDAEGLAGLVADAAKRAWEVATGAGTSGLELSRRQDLARRASLVLGMAALPAMARRAAVSARDLAGWGLVWRYGGAAGLEVLDEGWAAPAEVINIGRAALLAADGGAPDSRVTARANRVTSGRRQLRVDENGNWYLFHRVLGRWELTAAPAEDPADLLRSTREPPGGDVAAAGRRRR